ncbi:uncharacterized protein LOC129743717 [Uranotaenia lowii]|uniref:uncharacterized protein LOC129743717 n=1 Tax=Uranotaenia lowii TaxID=190385 RepID=UPI0024786F36|nr:uncharacterized protein LOC129743717 [Uranotaenia lowii]
MERLHAIINRNSDLTQEQFMECCKLALELSIKSVVIPETIEIKLKYQMLRFRLSPPTMGNGESNFSEQSKSSFKKQVQKLKHFSTDRVLIVSNLVLNSLKIITHELFQLKIAEENRHVPFDKLIFCLKVFILIFSFEPDYEVYKLLINPQNVLEFLEVTLDSLDNGSVPTNSSTFETFSSLILVHYNLHKLFELKTLLCDSFSIACENKKESTKRTAIQQILKKLVALEDEQINTSTLMNLMNSSYSDSFVVFVLRLILLSSTAAQTQRVYLLFLESIQNCENINQLTSLCGFVGNLDRISQTFTEMCKNLKKCQEENFMTDTKYSIVTSDLLEELEITLDNSTFCNLEKIVVLSTQGKKLREMLSYLDFELAISRNRFIQNHFMFDILSKFLAEPRSLQEPATTNVCSLDIFKFLLEKHGCSTIDEIVHNSRNIPRELTLSLQLWQDLDEFEGTYPRLNCFETQNLHLQTLLTTLHAVEANECMSLSFNLFYTVIRNCFEAGSALIDQQNMLLETVQQQDVKAVEQYIDSGELCESEIILYVQLSRSYKRVTIGNYYLYLGMTERNVTKQFNLQIALDLRLYKLALSLLANVEIDLYPIELFSWSDLIEHSILEGNNPSAWRTHTFTEALHKLMRYGNLKSIRCLLECKPDFIPRGRTVVNAVLTGTESLLRNCDLKVAFRDIAETILKAQCKDRASSNSIRIILEYKSVAVLELYINMFRFTDDELFEQLCNAWNELKAIQVQLPRSLDIVLLYKMAKYGFKNLCVVNAELKDDLEWLDGIDTIENLMNQIRERPNSADYLDIDNELLFQLRMIHNQLFFIKDKLSLKAYRTREIIFLLTIFLKMFDLDEIIDNPDRNVYRMVIDKPTIILYLQFLVNQLVVFKKVLNQRVSYFQAIVEAEKSPELTENIGRSFWNRILTKGNDQVPLNKRIIRAILIEKIDLKIVHSEKDEEMNKNLIEKYHQIKQMHSLKKVNQMIMNLDPYSMDQEIFVAFFKRFLHVFGETIKCTNETSNLPKRVYTILKHGIFDAFKMHEKVRDENCHGYSVKKKYMRVSQQFWDFTESIGYLEKLKYSSSLLLFLTYNEYVQCMYATMRKCETLSKLQRYLQYLDDQTYVFETAMKNCLVKASAYIGSLENVVKNIDSSSITYQQKELLMKTEESLNFRMDILNRCKKMLEKGSIYEFKALQMFVFAAPNLTPVQKMIDVMRHPFSTDILLFFIESNLDTINSNMIFMQSSLRPCDKHISSVLGNVIKSSGLTLQAVTDYHCRTETRRLINKLFENTHLSQSEVIEIEETIHQKLHGKKKEAGKTKGKSHYYDDLFVLDLKKRIIKEVLGVEMYNKYKKEFQKDDERELQEVFNTIQRKIRLTLSKLNCSTIEDLSTNAASIPMDAVLALEQWQLEICEILISTNHFQDNFFTIRHELPLICGRNYRNYLAHDNLTYDVLTNSSRINVLVNALVIAEHKWELYSYQRKSPTAPKVICQRIAGFTWLSVQQKLLNAAVHSNNTILKLIIKKGGSVFGKFWSCKGPFDSLSPNSFEELSCLSTIIEKGDISNNDEQQIVLALKLGEFEKTFEKSKCSDHSFSFRIFAKNQNCFCLGGFLKNMLENSCYEEIYQFLVRERSKNLSLTVFSFCSEDFLKYVFIQGNEYLNPLAQTAAIVTHSFNLKFWLTNPTVIDIYYVDLAIAADNASFFKCVLLCCINNSPMIERLFLCCAIYGRISMLKEILHERPVLIESISTATIHASRYQQWETVEFLIQQDRRPSPGYSYQEGVEYAILFGNMSITRQFLESQKVQPPSVLEFVAKYGDLEMFESLLSYGLNPWSMPRVFYASIDGCRDDRIINLLTRYMFYAKNPPLDSNLTEWNEILRGKRLLRYLDSCYMENFSLLEYCISHNPQLGVHLLNKLKHAETISGKVSILLYDAKNSNSVDADLARITNMIQLLEKCKFAETDSKMSKLVLSNDEPFSKETVVGINIYKDEIATEKISKPFATKSILEFPHVLRHLDSYIRQKWNPVCFTCEFTLETDRIRSFKTLHIGTFYCSLEATTESIDPLEDYLNQEFLIDGNVFHGLYFKSHPEFIRSLLDSGINLANVDHLGRSGLAQLLNKERSYDFLEPFLTHCVERDLRDANGTHILHMKTNQGRTLLFDAFMYGDLPLVDFLYKQNIPLENPMLFPKGATTFEVAVYMNRPDIVEKLIEYGQNQVNSSFLGEPIIFCPVTRNDTTMLKLLFRSGIVIRYRNHKGLNVIVLAVTLFCNEALKLLLNHADPSDMLQEKFNDKNALEWAILVQNYEAYEILSEYDK